MASRYEPPPWSDADEAHLRLLRRVCTLPRPGGLRDLRDLTLLAAASTAGPLALFALGVGAGVWVAAGLAATAAAALGVEARALCREHPRLPNDRPADETNWRRAGFALLAGRHRPAVAARLATAATADSGRGAWARRSRG